MFSNLVFDSDLSAEELRGFARTVREIEWLLLVLVLLYHAVLVPDHESSTALAMAMFFFGAFVLAFHYVNFYRTETYWKLASETWVMIVFITWVLMYTGRLESPLLNLYLLVVIASALILGKSTTLLQMVLIAACYLWLGYPERNQALTFSSYVTTLTAQLAPLVLVGYITTMLSSDIRHALVQIKSLSETDALTGVYNMRAFSVLSDNVSRQAERYSRPFALLMIDSDSLKTVNDRHGHEAGNRLLKLTTRCIQTQLRESDLVARYGGDEFIVLLPETPCSGAVSVANKILNSIQSTPLPIRDQSVHVTASIGVAGHPEHGNSLEDIKEKADKAMYASKAAGKNRVTVYTG
ncbi:MAG: GGDEF domain-containing protein [Betaproteobacteria bacterium]|nr:GGDEF domain-containing protein [Betaproteobacteria bacterium]